MNIHCKCDTGLAERAPLDINIGPLVFLTLTKLGNILLARAACCVETRGSKSSTYPSILLILSRQSQGCTAFARQRIQSSSARDQFTTICPTHGCGSLFQTKAEKRHIYTLCLIKAHVESRKARCFEYRGSRRRGTQIALRLNALRFELQEIQLAQRMTRIMETNDSYRIEIRFRIRIVRELHFVAVPA